MVIAYMLLSARWDISSLYLRAVIPIAFVAACLIGYKRIGKSAAGGMLQAALFDGVALYPYARVMINGRDSELAQGLDTIVSANDHIAIFPPIAGG